MFKASIVVIIHSDRVLVSPNAPFTEYIQYLSIIIIVVSTIISNQASSLGTILEAS